MLCRISYEHYLSHMIDFFTKEELTNMSYAIISAGIRNQGTFNDSNAISSKKMIKLNQLYPSSDIIADYGEFPDAFKKEYISELKNFENLIYLSIVSNIVYNRHNIVLLYREKESSYIDILTEFIMKKFKLGCVNLDDLFKHGYTDIPIANRKKVITASEDIKLQTIKEVNQSMENSEAGRLSMLNRMNKKDKIMKLKQLGIKIPHDSSEKKITELLKEEWCEAEEED